MKEASIKDNNNNSDGVAETGRNHIIILILSRTIEGAAVAGLDNKKNLLSNLISNTSEIHLA
jgi:hypothetical protein